MRTIEKAVDVSDQLSRLDEIMRSLDAQAGALKPALCGKIAGALCHMQLGIDLLREAVPSPDKV